MNLIDIETQIKALRLSWIPRILDSTRKGPWKSYFNHYLKPYGGTFLLKCNYKDLTTLLNGFYSDLLWCEEFRNTFSDINYTERIIWNNKDITTGNQHLKEVAVCDCESHTVTLVPCQFWPGSPERHSVGFHFKLMDLVEKLFLQSHVSVNEFSELILEMTPPLQPNFVSRKVRN